MKIIHLLLVAMRTDCFLFPREKVNDDFSVNVDFIDSKIKLILTEKSSLIFSLEKMLIFDFLEYIFFNFMFLLF